ncbi:MAG: flagellar hook-associated protein FlgL [Cellvibrionales bacterium]|nr:flagellar hook-associated protein FlgL [Cellvibrionales bacterium]
MRLSSSQIYTTALRGITNASAEVARTQEQIASGKRVLTPSDDPVASTRIMALESELTMSKQYQRNMDNVEGRLQRAETQIDNVEGVIDRVRELVIRAGSGALTNQDRQQITVEINQRLEELVDLTNAQDETGSYIFSGFKTNTPAFSAIGDNFSFQGDEGVRYESIANGLNMASSESGKALFADIATVNNNVSVAASVTNSSDVQVGRGLVVDQAAFDAVSPEDYAIIFNDTTSVVPVGPNYSIKRLSDGQLIGANLPYDLATPIVINGVEVTLSDIPNPTDSFVIESTNKENMLNTVQRISASMASFSDPIERSAFIGDALDNLSNIQESLLSGRGRIGARLNTLESARTSQQSLDLISTGVLDELQGLDDAEAISRLSFQSFILEAAQQSFVKVANLSLFNFLR